jgi:hypothetical protein
MAAGSWIPFNIAKLKLANGASNVSGGTALVYMLTHR